MYNHLHFIMYLMLDFKLKEKNQFIKLWAMTTAGLFFLMNFPVSEIVSVIYIAAVLWYAAWNIIRFFAAYVKNQYQVYTK